MKWPTRTLVIAKFFITPWSRILFLFNIDVAHRGNLLNIISFTYLEYRGVNPLFWCLFISTNDFGLYVFGGGTTWREFLSYSRSVFLPYPNPEIHLCTYLLSFLILYRVCCRMNHSKIFTLWNVNLCWKTSGFWRSSCWWGIWGWYWLIRRRKASMDYSLIKLVSFISLYISFYLEWWSAWFHINFY